MWKREEIAPKEQFLLFSTLFYIYISNFRSQITYSFVKCGCSIYCFPHSLNSDKSRYGYLEVFQCPLEFEITRVDCISICCLLKVLPRVLSVNCIGTFLLSAASAKNIYEACEKRLNRSKNIDTNKFHPGHPILRLWRPSDATVNEWNRDFL